MNEGQKILVEKLRDALTLAEYNPCRASDKTLHALANGMEALLSAELNLDLSREAASRFLGMSTRNLGRKVASGEVPAPKRKGHKAISFPALLLAKIARKRK